MRYFEGAEPGGDMGTLIPEGGDPGTYAPGTEDEGGGSDSGG
jgi:hypothetical protein